MERKKLQKLLMTNIITETPYAIFLTQQEFFELRNIDCSWHFPHNHLKFLNQHNLFSISSSLEIFNPHNTSLGNGRLTRLWKENWLDPSPLELSFPLLRNCIRSCISWDHGHFWLASVYITWQMEERLGCGRTIDLIHLIQNLLYQYYAIVFKVLTPEITIFWLASRWFWLKALCEPHPWPSDPVLLAFLFGGRTWAYQNF